MRRKTKIQIIYRNCPRCNKRVAGTNRAIHGADNLHSKYAGLCSSCATQQEKKEILDGQAKAILGKNKVQAF